ncbi:MAG: hypothetical protein GX587_14850 [Bacteroidales bacterium]|nr:hypothetical protein [Bacteroidales bacterium]
MADFNYALGKTLHWEGGYQKMAKDTGNYNSKGELVGTNLGICAKVYESFIGHPPTEKEMRDIDIHTATRIYKTRFWDKMHGDQFKDNDVAANVFDFYVNAGTWGIYHSKKAANMAGCTLKVSHSLSVSEVASLNDLNQDSLFEAVKNHRLAYYNNLVKKKPQYSVFLKGWLNRANSFYK